MTMEGTWGQEHPPSGNEKPAPDITLLLGQASQDRGAADELFRLIMRQLRDLASRMLRGSLSPETYQTMDLVNQAYVRVFGPGEREFVDRQHFFAYMSQSMRSILSDHARKNKRDKRAHAAESVPIDQIFARPDLYANALLELDEELASLSSKDPRLHEALSLRYIVGLSVKDISLVMELNQRAVERLLMSGKSLLRGRLTK